MLCIPKANHKKLVDDCFPAAKALVGAAPEYRPNSNELGRLCYYSQSKPAKLVKVGRLIAARASSDSRALQSGGGNERHKAGLMMTLFVLRELVSSCKTSLVYLAPAAQSVLCDALEAAAPRGSSSSNRAWDADLSARAAATFALYARNVPAPPVDDQSTVRSVLRVLEQLRSMADVAATGSSAVEERMRLNSLGGMDGVVHSPVLYSAAFPELSALLLPPLLEAISPWHLSFEQTKQLTAANEAPVAPAADAATAEDTARAALTLLEQLVRSADVTQLRILVQHVLAWLDTPTPAAGARWAHETWPVWLFCSLVQWASPASRYTVPHLLVESLQHGVPCTAGGMGGRTPSVATDDVRDPRLLEALHVILTSKTDIVGLNMAELLDGHVHFLLVHVQREAGNMRVRATIDAVGQLARYTLYADQLADFVRQIALHLAAVQRSEQPPAQRDNSLRALLYCLISIFRATSEAVERVPLTAWVGTESLLAHPNAAVRLTYLDALYEYVQVEHRRGDAAEPLSDSLRFLHGLYARAMQAVSSASTTPADFAALQAVHNLLMLTVPVATALASVPMLFALERAASAPVTGDAARIQRTLASRWLVSCALVETARVSGAQRAAVSLEQRAMQLRCVEPRLPELDEQFVPNAKLPPPFAPTTSLEALQSEMDVEGVAAALADSHTLQDATYTNAQWLRAWFLRPWSAEGALADAPSGLHPSAASAGTGPAVGTAGQATAAAAPAGATNRQPTVDVSELRRALSSAPRAAPSPRRLRHRSSSMRTTNVGDLLDQHHVLHTPASYETLPRLPRPQVEVPSPADASYTTGPPPFGPPLIAAALSHQPTERRPADVFTETAPEDNSHRISLHGGAMRIVPPAEALETAPHLAEPDSATSGEVLPSCTAAAAPLTNVYEQLGTKTMDPVAM